MLEAQTLLCSLESTEKTHLTGEDNEMQLLILLLQMGAIHHLNNMRSTVSMKEVSLFFFSLLLSSQYSIINQLDPVWGNWVPVTVTILTAKLKASLRWLVKQAVLRVQVMLQCLLAFPLSEMRGQKGIFIVLLLPLSCESGEESCQKEHGIIK